MDDLFADRAVRDQTLVRVDIERLVGRPQTLIDCDLDDANLSGLDLSDWTFERCSLRRVDATKANLERTVWRSCRGAFANLPPAT